MNNIKQLIKQINDNQLYELKCENIGASISDFQCLIESLKKNRSVTKLDLTDKSIGTRNTILILEMLYNNKNITEFSLKISYMAEGGLLEVVNLIKLNQTIVKFELNWYRSSKGRTDIDAFSKIEQAIKENNNIIYFNDKETQNYSIINQLCKQIKAFNEDNQQQFSVSFYQHFFSKKSAISWFLKNDSKYQSLNSDKLLTQIEANFNSDPLRKLNISHARSQNKLSCDADVIPIIFSFLDNSAKAELAHYSINSFVQKEEARRQLKAHNAKCNIL